MESKFGITLEGISKFYYGHQVVSDINLDVNQGEFLTLLGPSGCGKSTTLRMIAGFITPEHGKILIGDKDVSHLPPQKRDIGIVFQNYALFPNMSIFSNVAFPLQIRKWKKNEVEERVMELLELTNLTKNAKSYPSEISGGMAQRVALARALAFRPKILLMDEPLAALDLKLRHSMQLELKHIQEQLGVTTVYVTHDQEEALAMSDRVVVMNEGRIVQVDKAEQIYHSPNHAFVADFIGQINLFEATIEGVSDDGETLRTTLLNGVEMLVQSSSVPKDTTVGRRVHLGVRPENFQIVSVNGTPDTQLSGTLSEVIFAGSIVKYLVVVVGLPKPIVLNRLSSEIRHKVGDTLQLHCQPQTATIIEDGLLEKGN